MPTRSRAKVTRSRAFARSMLRSGVVSLFWACIDHKRRTQKYILKVLADDLSVDKSAVSRWFSGADFPNWTLNTVADIADSLNLEIEFRAYDRASGVMFTTAGVDLSNQTMVTGIATSSKPSFRLDIVNENTARRAIEVVPTKPYALAS